MTRWKVPQTSPDTMQDPDFQKLSFYRNPKDTGGRSDRPIITNFDPRAYNEVSKLEMEKSNLTRVFQNFELNSLALVVAIVSNGGKSHLTQMNKALLINTSESIQNSF
jgi:hypothetical protein